MTNNFNIAGVVRMKKDFTRHVVAAVEMLRNKMFEKNFDIGSHA